MGSEDYRRKRAAIEAKIREKHAAALATADYWQRREIEARIRREIRKSGPSLYCLWAAR